MELKSVDVVTRPSAGGRFVAAKESEMKTDVATEDVNTGAGETAVRQAERLLGEVRKAQLSFACGQALNERLAGLALPELVMSRVRQQWMYAPNRWVSSDEYTRALEAALKLEVESLGQLRDALMGGAGADGDVRGPRGDAARQGLVTGMGGVRVEASAEEKQRLVVQLGLDRLFGLQESEDDPHVARARQLGLLPSLPRWRGLREAYGQITGDFEVSGVVSPAGSVAREANEVTTGVLNFALLNSMTKRLVRDYQGQPQDWRKLCSVVPLKDFKSQDRVRLHDFASLATVAEGAAYTNLPWDDGREAYAPSKRGNLVVVTREAIINDDVRAIRRIPQKLARSAGITMNEFVYGLFTSNPFMSDGTKVFDDGVQTSHANRGTAALSAAALQAAITSLLKQTDSATKRLNLKPRYLLVPADLLFTALTIVNSTLIPGSANNDANVLQGAVEPISVAQLTDATDYYLVCDPLDVDGIEIGFVGGREEPELLMQDRPDQGQVFTNDQISFKIRWEFGGGWLDYRGAFWGNVAG